MRFYSTDDKFSRGVTLILFIPLAIPHLYLYSKDSLISVLILIIFFGISVYLDWKKMYQLYSCGGDNKRYVVTVLITVLLNFVLSFYLNDNKWLFLILPIWCLYLGLKAAKVSRQFKNKKL